MTTDRIRPAPLLIEPLRVLPVVLIALLAVVTAVDLLLVAQPPLIASLRDGWQHALNTGGVPASWASFLAAGLGVAGIALAAAVLSTFIRVAHVSPYATLAPVLVGCCTLVLGRMPVTLPVPVSTALFAGLATLMLIGGGNLFRSSGFFVNTAGALLASTPLALLWMGYFGVHGSSAAALHPFDRNAQVFMFVLVFASIGAPLLAIACRRPRHAHWGQNADDLGGQIVELLERAEASEARAHAAERQLSRRGGGGGTLRLSSDDDALAMMRPASGPWLRLASWLCLAAFLAGAYFAGYVPLQKRLSAQVMLNKTQLEQHAAALTALHVRFEHERHELEQQLGAAHPAGAAQPVARPAADKLSAIPAPHGPVVPAESTGKAAVGPAQKPATAPQPAAAGKPTVAPTSAQPRLTPTGKTEGNTAAMIGAPHEKAATAKPLPNDKPVTAKPLPNDTAAKAKPTAGAESPTGDAAADKTASGQTVRASHVAAKTEKHHAAAAANKDANALDEPSAAPKPARAASAGVSRANDPLEGLDGM